MIVFSLMSPLGIGIGIAVTEAMEDQSTAYTLSVAILQVWKVDKLKKKSY